MSNQVITNSENRFEISPDALARVRARYWQVASAVEAVNKAVPVAKTAAQPVQYQVYGTSAAPKTSTSGSYQSVQPANTGAEATVVTQQETTAQPTTAAENPSLQGLVSSSSTEDFDRDAWIARARQMVEVDANNAGV